MKLTASSILPQICPRRCCELPVESKQDAISEMVPITTVERMIRGAEKNQDRSQLNLKSSGLIATAPGSYQQLPSLGYQVKGTSNKHHVTRAGIRNQRQSLRQG